VELGVELSLKYLTFYAFSTENWSRPKEEVNGLLKMLKERLIKEIPELNKQNIYVQFIGTDTGLEPGYWSDVKSVADVTHKNTGMVVNIAFNYGGRLEIIEAIKQLYQELSPDEVRQLNPEDIGRFLWTKGQPDPDLIIRTSGEMRLSNFLLWQSAYSEIYVTETLWPDFDKIQMMNALLNFQSRERRFGGRK
jgi:undecaprenyl diphosphate synthase